MQKDDTPSVLQDIASQIPKEFALIEFLGEGGHGIVIKALQQTLQQTVALKIIKADRSDETNKRIARMQNEAKILAKLKHKNIVQVLQLGSCHDGTPFLVCEFLDGITLEQLLKTTPQPSPRVIVEIFTQILDALSCAHENGLLHRDIKPSNIMLIKDGETDTTHVKVLDFGIARDFETIDSMPIGLTRTIQISGSAPYMSPEQCKGQRIDQRSDLYSVACVLYECLSGQPPFTGETAMHTRYLQINQEAEIPKADKYAHTSSRAAVYRLVLDALSKDPQQRPRSADEFKARLLNALPHARNRLFWTPRKDWKNRKPFFLAASVICLIAATFTAFQQLHKQTEDVQKPISKKHHGEKIVSVSREVPLKGLVSRFTSFRYDGSPEQMKTGLELREDFVDLIKSLRPRLDSNAMYYTALRAKADLELRLHYLDKSFDSWNELLKYCRTPNNEISIEAIECYWMMSSIAFNKNDYSKAKQLALEGIAIQNNAGPNGPPLIDIPPLYEMRPQSCTAECYAVLADIAQAQNKFADELTLREKAELARLAKQRIDVNPKYYINFLNAALKAKGKEEAYALANKRYQDYCKQADEGPSEGELANSFSELGLWYFKNTYLREAANCYALAKKIYSGVEPDDRQDEKLLLERRYADLRSQQKK